MYKFSEQVKFDTKKLLEFYLKKINFIEEFFVDDLFLLEGKGITLTPETIMYTASDYPLKLNEIDILLEKENSIESHPNYGIHGEKALGASVADWVWHKLVEKKIVPEDFFNINQESAQKETAAMNDYTWLKSQRDNPFSEDSNLPESQKGYISGWQTAEKIKAAKDSDPFEFLKSFSEGEGKSKEWVEGFTDGWFDYLVSMKEPVTAEYEYKEEFSENIEFFNKVKANFCQIIDSLLEQNIIISEKSEDIFEDEFVILGSAVLKIPYDDLHKEGIHEGYLLDFVYEEDVKKHLLDVVTKASKHTEIEFQPTDWFEIRKKVDGVEITLGYFVLIA